MQDVNPVKVIRRWVQQWNLSSPPGTRAWAGKNLNSKHQIEIMTEVRGRYFLAIYDVDGLSRNNFHRQLTLMVNREIASHRTARKKR